MKVLESQTILWCVLSFEKRGPECGVVCVHVLQSRETGVSLYTIHPPMSLMHDHLVDFEQSSRREPKTCPATRRGRQLGESCMTVCSFLFSVPVRWIPNVSTFSSLSRLTLHIPTSTCILTSSSGFLRTSACSLHIFFSLLPLPISLLLPLYVSLSPSVFLILMGCLQGFPCFPVHSPLRSISLLVYSV